MSDPVVIAVFKTRLETLNSNASPPISTDVPYLDTLNTRPTPPLPERFTSLERDFAAVDCVAIGGAGNRQFRETGTLTVVVTVRSGTGASEAETISERVRELFHAFEQTHIHVTSVGSATVFDPDDGSYFQLKVPVNYFFDFFR